jgi:putative PIN family toxin of toxin-antitoxin system
MSRRVVVDTNLWIRALLGGPVTLQVLEAWRADKFVVLISQPLLDELEAVAQRPRLRLRIDSTQSKALVEQLHWRGQWAHPCTWQRSVRLTFGARRRGVA